MDNKNNVSIQNWPMSKYLYSSITNQFVPEQAIDEGLCMTCWYPIISDVSSQSGDECSDYSDNLDMGQFVLKHCFCYQLSLFLL